ncbi:glutathione S-transferase N-terminal domain-containing protein [Maritalea sp.]|uniref:glutathione S-transferase N-terminal domain-containing protein n=1 Tax=Maritalea sp. TaxID=2003361 RepID=UPI003EFA518F
MKLLYSHASPYARKCRITAIEKDITSVEEVLVNPYEETEKVSQTNPLGKIPCLIYGNGETLFDSSVICAYFDTISDGPRLMPEEGVDHWAMRRHEALCSGILDSAVNMVIDGRKPEIQRSAHWGQRWTCAIARSLSQLNSELDQFSGNISTAQIALGATIGYLNFRLGDHDFLAPHPELHDWYGEFSQHPSMQQTMPK